MAGYPPPPSFGPAPGQRGQAVPFQYPTPQNLEYAYAGPSQSTNISAFEQNTAALTPGLEYNARPFPFNPTAPNSRAPPLPIYGGLNPSTLYQRPVWASQANPPGIPTPLDSSMIGVVPGRGPFALQPGSMPEGGTELSATRSRQQAIEDGELSEGEYEEDNVEGITGPARREGGSYNGYQADRGRRSNGTAGQRQSGFEKKTPVPLTDPYGRSRDMHRQSSDSYSPPSSGPDGSVFAAAQQPELPAQTVAVMRGGSITNRQEENRKHELDNHKSLTSASISRATSVQDARRQAQNAVLNLIPLKVRFQNFVDEGIDEEIIRSVFDDIGMSSSYSPTKKLSVGITQTQQTVASAVSDSITSSAPQIHSKLNINNTNTNGTSQHTSNSQQTINSTIPIPSKGEERKDRIARLLEEKSKKLMSLSQPMSPAIPILTDNALENKSTTSQSTTKVDKEKLLKQKMEALQKSREARAQKATAKQTATSTMQSGATGPSQPEISHPSTSVPAVSPPHDIRTYSASPQHLESQTSMPSIPGLFLSNTSGTFQPNMPQSTSIVKNANLRKRPVASDFDSNTPTNTTYKRPFGHNRNDQRLVIDVSEEESDNESVEMEIDDQVGGISTQGIQAANPLRPGLRDLPPLSDFAPKKSYPAPSSTLSTPPSLQCPQRTSTRPEDLKRKEIEIQEMRRKIAEAEQRKKAKLVASGSQTPMNKASTPVENRSAKDASISNKIHTSVHIERLIDDASQRIKEEQEKLSQAQALKEHSAEDLERKETEQRRQRRARIAADLPVVDAEVQESQRRLAGLREEMENLELAVQKRLEEKRKLAEEMEQLGHEVDDQLEAQKDQLICLTTNMAMEQDGDLQVLPEKIEAVSFPVESTLETVADQEDVSMSDHQPSPESPASREQTTTEDVASKNPRPTPAEDELSDSQPRLCDSPSEELPPSNLVDRQSSEAIVVGLPTKPSFDQDTASAADTNMTERQASQPSLQPRDQLQTPPVDLNFKDTNPSSRQDSQQDTDDEMDMEESIVDDAESMQSKDMEIDEPYPPDQDSAIGFQAQNDLVPESFDLAPNLDSTPDGDSDIYEPPEATPPSSTELIAANSSPFSPQSPESTQDVPGTDQEMPLAPYEGSIEPVKPVGAQLSHRSNDEDGTKKATTQKSFFTPYESPLKRFKGYRFHPDFTKQVPGGYKSLTYSNNIDDSKELCRFELAGGVCNDVSCEFQHFRDIVLPDELILVSLGDSSGYKEEDRTRFIKGLKEVLQDLRISKIRDFQVIASKICIFRQSMFEDSSKVLLLDSPAI